MNKTNCNNNQKGSFRLNYGNAMYWSFGSPHLQVNGPSLSSLLAALASSPNTQGDRSLALSCKNCKDVGDRPSTKGGEKSKKATERKKSYFQIHYNTLVKVLLISLFPPLIFYWAITIKWNCSRKNHIWLLTILLSSL